MRQLGMDNHPHRGGYKDKVMLDRQEFVKKAKKNLTGSSKNESAQN